VPEPQKIDAATARRFLALHHFLAPPRALPAVADSVLTVIDRLGSMQFDPLGIAGRNHDLVLQARIRGYRPAWTDELLYERRALFEAYNKGLSILPSTELPWYRVTWERNREEHEAGTFQVHAELVKHLLGRIRAEGPLSSLDFERRPDIDWYWRPTNQVRAILEALAEAGTLGLARRQGNRRYYDLMERLFPAELLAERRPREEQLRHKLLSRYRAHGLLGATGSAELWYGTGPAAAAPTGRAAELPRRAVLRQQLIDSGELVPVQVDGVRALRYVVRTDLGLLEQARAEIEAGSPPGGAEPGVSFLAPLDPLVWDRDFLRQLYGFDYIWEVYVPEAKRRWGYYVLPILFGDRLVGRIEPRIERVVTAPPTNGRRPAKATSTVRVVGLWWEDGFDPRRTDGLVDAMRLALRDYLTFAGSRQLLWRPGLGGWGRLFTLSGHPAGHTRKEA